MRFAAVFWGEGGFISCCCLCVCVYFFYCFVLSCYDLHVFVCVFCWCSHVFILFSFLSNNLCNRRYILLWKKCDPRRWGRGGGLEKSDFFVWVSDQYLWVSYPLPLPLLLLPLQPLRITLNKIRLSPSSPPYPSPAWIFMLPTPPPPPLPHPPPSPSPCPYTSASIHQAVHRHTICFTQSTTFYR